MSFLRIQHVGVVVESLRDACAAFEDLLGMTSRDFRDDQGKGMQYDARILLGNECWLHLVQNWDQRSRVNRFLAERGEGLEHIAIETDDIEGDVAHLREIGVPIFEDRIFPANDGYEAFVFPDQLPGLTVELIQSHETSWVYPKEAVGKPLSSAIDVVGLDYLGLAVDDVTIGCERFKHLFGLQARDYRTSEDRETVEARIPFDNQCSLRLAQSAEPASPVHQFLRRHGEGLDRVALRTHDIEADVAHLERTGVSLFGDGIIETGSGREALIHPDRIGGVTVGLVQRRGI